MADKLYFTNGVKSAAINDSWDFVDLMKSDEVTGIELYGRVAAVHQSINKTARACANMPFTIYDKSGNAFDDSASWENKVGFMPNPVDLIRRVRLSLIMCNTAYLRMGKNKLGKSMQLHYVKPESIAIKTNNVTGEVEALVRSVNGRPVETYAPDDYSLLRFWWLDNTTELLPSQNSEYKSMLDAAGILFYSDFFTRNFYQRGGVKPSLIAVKGMIMQDKKEDLQKEWTSWIRGIGKFARQVTAKMINAEAMDVKPFGEGLGDLKETPVYKQAIENIAIALDMPLSFLLSNSENYATAQISYINWYRNSIAPWCNFIAGVLNDQLFTPMGLHWEYTPETTELEQNDEVKRTQALSGMADALLKYPDAETFFGAADVYGFELTDSFIEAVNKFYAKKAESKPIEQAQRKPIEKQETEKPATVRWTPNADEREELRVWCDVALRRHKKGAPLEFDYIPHFGGLPANVTDIIRTKLAQAVDAESIKSSFDIDFYQTQKSEIELLADSLNALADKMK